MNLTFHEFCELLARDLLDPVAEMSYEQMRIQLTYAKAAQARRPLLAELATERYGALFAAIHAHPSHHAKTAEGEAYRQKLMRGEAKIGTWE